jgi:hypothetical protein
VEKMADFCFTFKAMSYYDTSPAFLAESIIRAAGLIAYDPLILLILHFQCPD